MGTGHQSVGQCSPTSKSSQRVCDEVQIACRVTTRWWWWGFIISLLLNFQHVNTTGFFCPAHSKWYSSFCQTRQHDTLLKALLLRSFPLMMVVSKFLWMERPPNCLKCAVRAPALQRLSSEACRQEELSCLPWPVGVGEELVVWRG